MYAIAEFSNDFNPTNLSNPSSLQINSQLVARGAGGRGEALGSAAPGRRPDAGRLQFETVSVRSRDLLKRNPPPSRPPLTPAPLPIYSSWAVSETHPKNEPKIEGSMNTKWMPMEVPKLSKNRTHGSQEPSREPLGTNSMNYPVSERSREGPMCFPCSKYNAFDTCHKVSPGALLAPFWLPFWLF